ncbi:hypothetical protein LSH36_167g10006 [Paralvinella palmiformis]|uniref:Protein kinase domain-containing protein n=1 Tax=Paralvinella palmiformis TaxID=53620 RepID=A0AAD9JTE0_9ANNE|nr:hypothetical protein LSH36_167g10006 [Paralvinella palmiformis]
MSALQRLRERLHQSARHKTQDGDDLTDTCDIKPQESNRVLNDASENTGHSTDITQHKLWLQKIQENGNKAEDWLEVTNFAKNSMSYTSWKTYISHLCMLYAKAFNAINLDSHKDDVAYAQLLINFADIKSNISVEEARSLLHFARKNLKKHAVVHIAAAQLELSQGNRSKAGQLLEKALQIKATPEDQIRTALQNLEAGKSTLCPYQERSLSADDKENLVQPISVNSAVDSEGGMIRCNTTETAARCVPSRSLVFSDTAKSEVKPSHGDHLSKLNKIQTMVEPTNVKSSISSNTDQLAQTRSDVPQDKSGSISLSSLQMKTEVKCVYSSHTSKPNKPGSVVASDLISHVVGSSQPNSQSTPSQVVSTNTVHGISFDDSTVTFRKSKMSRNVHSCTESDDGDTVPVPLDKEKGVYKRTLTSYNSTPDCKGPGFFNYISTRKSGALGKPRRVKRTSMPQLSECALTVDEDLSNQKLTSLAEADVSSLIVHAECDPHGPSLMHDSSKANQTIEFEDVRMLSNNSMSEGWGKMNESNTNEMPFDEDTSKQDRDSGVITTTPEELPHPSRSHSSMSIMDKSTGSTATTVKPNILHSCTGELLHERSSNMLLHSSQTLASSRSFIHPHQQKDVSTTCSGALPSCGEVHSVGVLPSANIASSSGVISSSNMVPLSGMPLPPNIPQALFQPTRNRPKETLTVCGKVYTVLNVLGRGGSSEVYNTLDQTYNLRAIKCVNFSGADEATFKSYMNEIKLLKRLQYSDRIIKLFDYEYVSDEEMLYVVMERGDTDLATLFRQHNKSGAFDTLTQKFYWMEMLKAVQVLHNEGIVHSDLKPANFLLVVGRLKLIDFGIAKALHQDKTSITCEQAVGTLNYMSPEAIMDTCGGTAVDSNGQTVSKIKIGVKSDVWSLGCILYNMVYGKSPFHHINNSILKLQAITNPKVDISFPDTADPILHQVLMMCLQRDPKQRPSVKDLLAYGY